VEHVKAVSGAQVVTALQRKIARERVGVEVAGCLQGPHPADAAQHFEALQCFAAVFQPPPSLAANLGTAFGTPCACALQLAHPLLLAQGQQVLYDFGCVAHGTTVVHAMRLLIGA
jgi:tRNA nucleotidyltransferase/poly(A) polymerase